MNNKNVPNDDRAKIVEQFEKLIRQECPDMAIDTLLKFDEKGFSKMH